MNITKEQMLERIREWKGAFDTHPDKMDEWSLCFMEDYKVYDAIRSLIESSGEKASGVGERPRIPSASELPEEWRKQLSAIEGHVCKPDDTCSCYQLADTPNEKCPVHGSGLWPAHCAECGRFLPAPSPGPTIKKDLTVEVEEAIKHAAEFRLGLWVEFLKMPGLDKELDPLLWNESDEAALAVIRAALTATIKPPLTVAQTTKVTREWVSWFVKTLFDMKMRGVTFPVEGAAETMLQSVGIEVEP